MLGCANPRPMSPQGTLGIIEMKSEGHASWPCPSLALEKLTLPLTEHYSKKADPLASQERWPLNSGEMAIPLATGESEPTLRA